MSESLRPPLLRPPDAVHLLPSTVSTCHGEDFLYKHFKGTPSARQTGPGTARIACRDAALTEGERERA